jgi:hypothetical protein
MDATAFNRCNPGSPDRQDIHVRRQGRIMWTGKMAELYWQMQEGMTLPAFHFDALPRDPQANPLCKRSCPRSISSP